jgi:hypothetical protein
VTTAPAICMHVQHWGFRVLSMEGDIPRYHA